MLKPLLVMVAGAKKICIWRPENQVIRRSSEDIISWVKQKNEFTRQVLESSTDLTLGQSEWWIKELVKKGVIRKTRKTMPNKIGKGCKLTLDLRVFFNACKSRILATKAHISQLPSK